MSFDSRTLSGIGVLVAVAEAGNFARAGETLGLTPSGVSRAIARLETRVGARLFDRSPRAVTLTEAGRRFHERTLPILESLEDAATELASDAGEVRGRLRGTLDPWFARMVLAPALPAFLAAHPRLSLEFTVSNHREEMMTGADVAVRFGPADRGALIARKLAETRVITCAAPAYLERHGTPRSPRDLARHEIILFRDPATGLPFEWEFEANGKRFEIEPAGRLLVDDPTLAVEVCAAGHGIYQSLQMGLEPWLESGRLVPILGKWSKETYPLYAFHASRRLLPAKVRVFVDFLHQLAAGAGGAAQRPAPGRKVAR